MPKDDAGDTGFRRGDRLERANALVQTLAILAAGAWAAFLSTASGLLLVISSSIANDVYYKRINPQATEARQLMVGRIAMAGAIVVAGYLGINPPGFVAQVVALAFGLGAASFFPVLVLGIFWKKCTAAGATAGMVAGLGTTLAYQLWTIDIYGNSDGLFGISETPDATGAVGVGASATPGAIERVPPPPVLP